MWVLFVQCTFGTEPFEGPSQLHSSIWVMFSFPEASLRVLFLKKKSCHWPLSQSVELGPHGQKSGDELWGHSWLDSELTLQSSISLGAPASSLRSIQC